MASTIPNILINYNLYRAGSNLALLGVTDATLANIQNIVDNYKAAGIAGSYDLPVIGHFQPMSTTVTFTTVYGDNISLLRQTGQDLIFRASLQTQDTSTNTLIPVAERVVMKVVPKGMNLGKGVVGEAQGNSVDLSILYLALYFNNVKRIELDPAHMVCMVDGVDYLQAVREQI